MTIDYRPLFVPVNKDEVALFRRESQMTARPWAHRTSRFPLVVLVTVAVVGLIGLVSFGSILARFDESGSSTVSVIPFILIMAIAAFGVYRMWRGSSSRWESLLRRTRFASVNGLTYLPDARNPDYPGMIFSLGSSKKVSDIYRSTGSPQFELANYQYTTGSGKNETTHTWGYLALKLERKLPHMLLDARANNGLLGGSNLPTNFRRDQRLSLEGDFDKHFTLYCPKAYERDALYVFTPDLMALLIDESASYDVEIIDDWMFVYSSRTLALDEAKTVHRLFRIIEMVGAKTLRQTERYADERIGDSRVNLVAPQGQRLKRGYTFASVAMLLIFAWVAFNFVRVWL